MKVCVIWACEKPVRARGLCHKHYNVAYHMGSFGDEKRRYGQVGCKVDGCDRGHVAKGYCSRHYMAERYRTDEEYRKRAKAQSNRHYQDVKRLLYRRKLGLA